MPYSLHLRALFCVLASSITSLFSGALHAQNEPTPPPSPQAEMHARVSALHTRIAQEGPQRVIIKLKGNFTQDSQLNARAASAQRSTIASTQATLQAPLSAHAQHSSHHFETVPYMAMEVDQSDLAALAQHPDVADIQEDRLHSTSLPESIPIVHAPEAWSAGYTGNGWAVAILDTGVDKTHPFLANKVLSEACYSTTLSGTSSSLCPGGVGASTDVDSGLNCTISSCYHGTHVAGIATGSGSSFSGVAKSASIISIKVFSRFDSKSYCTSPPCVLSWTTDIIKGLERVYALRNTYAIASVNLSLGGDAFAAPCDTDAMKPVIDNLRAAGIATVIAAGNAGLPTSLASPACISSAISVGSTDDTGAQGISYFSNFSSFLTLLAPGNLIYSSVPGGGFANLAGTSMSTPHVAGCWAVLKQARPYATVDEISLALSSTGQSVVSAATGMAKPRIDCAAALKKLPTPAQALRAWVPIIHNYLLDP